MTRLSAYCEEISGRKKSPFFSVMVRVNRRFKLAHIMKNSRIYLQNPNYEIPTNLDKGERRSSMAEKRNEDGRIHYWNPN